MFSNNNMSLILPNNDRKNSNHQTLCPTYSLTNSHYKSTPNFVAYFDDQVCLSNKYLYVVLII